MVGLAQLVVRGGCLGRERVRPLERTKASEPDAEERAAPLGEERLDTVGLVDLDGVGDLGRRVTGLGEGGNELLVQVLRGRRRLDADGELGARVQRVLEAEARPCSSTSTSAGLSAMRSRRVKAVPTRSQRSVTAAVYVCRPPVRTDGSMRLAIIRRSPVPEVQSEMTARPGPIQAARSPLRP